MPEKLSTIRRRLRILRYTLRFFFLALSIILISIVIALSQLDLENFRDELVAQTKNQTGLNVQIDGTVSWRLSLRPKIILNDIKIANADWAKNKNGLTADQLIVTLNLFSLFTSSPSVEELQLISTKLFLEMDKSGKYSMEITTQKDSKTEEKIEHPRYPLDPLSEIRYLYLDRPEITYITPDKKWSFKPTTVRISHAENRSNMEYKGYLMYNQELYPFHIVMEKLDRDRGVYPLRIQLDNSDINFVAHLALEKTSLMPIDFNITGELDRIEIHLGYLGINGIPDITPLKFSMNAGLDHNKLTINKLKITGYKNDVNAKLIYDWSKKKPTLSGSITSNSIDLGLLFPKLYGHPDPEKPSPDRPLNVFMDTPIYPELLALMDANISADVKNLRIYRLMDVKNIKTNISLENNNLKLIAQSDFASGSLMAAVNGSLNRDGKSLSASASGIGTHIMAGEILASIHHADVLSGMPGDFQFYFTANGHDLSSLMSSVTGSIRIYSTDRGIAHDASFLFMGQDFLTSVQKNVKDIFVDSKNKNDVRVQCSAINLKIRNGYVETKRGIAVESNLVNILGEGYVDLGREKLQAAMVTTPSKGLKLSLSGQIVDMMEVKGSIAEPTISVNQSGILNKTLTSTAAGLALVPLTGGISIAATAGLGLVAGTFLSSWLTDEHPCQTALQSGAPSHDDDPEFMYRPVDDLAHEFFINTQNQIKDRFSKNKKI